MIFYMGPETGNAGIVHKYLTKPSYIVIWLLFVSGDTMMCNDAKYLPIHLFAEKMRIKADKLDPFLSHLNHSNSLSELSFYICMMNVEVDVRIYWDNSFQNWIQNLKSDILSCVVTVLT